MIGTSNFPDQIEDITQPYMTARRFFFFVLVTVTVLFLAEKFVNVVSVDGFGFLDFIMTSLFVICLPWTVVGFWNGIIGFCVMQMSVDAVKAVTPFSINILNQPIITSTAILFCIRDEDVKVVFNNIIKMTTGLAKTNYARQFHIYILSDTTDALIAEEEDESFNALKKQFLNRINITYRLRESNLGFKAGNIRDFCDRWGMNHDFMIVLDADSFMSSQAILNLVQIAQDNPRLGIVQHLTVGLPSSSAFTRIFQFGMRLGMQSYTVGSAWWQGDCGPYWGHNAIIRIVPFIEHCKLPQISGTGALSGDILSHDQIEAVMMRRAGYECRIWPVEDGSFEENPPSVLEFLRRDLRWCQGNMQYLKLLGMKGIKPISMYQLCFAIGMFIGAPATLIFWIIAALRLLSSGSEDLFFVPEEAKSLAVIYLVMGFIPKIATLIHVLLNAKLRTSFGGGLIIIAGSVLETVFSFLLVPVAAASEAIFIFRLMFGKAVGWGAHNRVEHQLSFEDASSKLLPHTLLGVGFVTIFGLASHAAFWWTLPMNLGLIVSIPFAIFTTNFKFGRFLKRNALCCSPEELNPPSYMIEFQENLKAPLHDV